MSSQWVRVNVRANLDPSIRRSGKFAWQVFETLLRIAKEQGRGGLVPQEYLCGEELAFWANLHGFESDLERALSRLVDNGLLEPDEDGALRIGSWARYQKDRTAAERKRRQRSRAAERDVTDDEDTERDRRDVTLSRVTPVTQETGETPQCDAVARTSGATRHDVTRDIRDVTPVTRVTTTGRDSTVRDIQDVTEEEGTRAYAREPDPPPPPVRARPVTSLEEIARLLVDDAEADGGWQASTTPTATVFREYAAVREAAGCQAPRWHDCAIDIAASVRILTDRGKDPVAELVGILDYCANSGWRTSDSRHPNRLIRHYLVFGGFRFGTHARVMTALSDEAYEWRRKTRPTEAANTPERPLTDEEAALVQEVFGAAGGMS